MPDINYITKTTDGPRRVTLRDNGHGAQILLIIDDIVYPVIGYSPIVDGSSVCVYWTEIGLGLCTAQFEEHALPGPKLISTNGSYVELCEVDDMV